MEDDRLGSSSWSVFEARSMVARLRHVAKGSEYDGVELFLALCDYLDELHGDIGFDYVYAGAERAALANAIRKIRGPRPKKPNPDGERLIQPVNASVTLVEGRALAAELAAQDGWQRDLGLATQALYSYLDQLYGGPGAFTELLTSTERDTVASR